MFGHCLVVKTLGVALHHVHEHLSAAREQMRDYQVPWQYFPFPLPFVNVNSSLMRQGVMSRHFKPLYTLEELRACSGFRSPMK